MKKIVAFTAAALCMQVHAAHAHILLDFPATRTDSLKVGPCGAAGSTRGSNVTAIEPGATITVRWHETVNHPGHYRIMFDDAGEDAFYVPTAFDDIRPAGGALLVDGIADKSSGGSYQQVITLPDIECDQCTLQVIQMMTDKAPYGDGNDLYFQCADLTLKKGAGIPDGGAGGGGGDDSCQASRSAGPGALALLALALALVVVGRRRRTYPVQR